MAGGLKGHIWLENRQGLHLGRGKAELLEQLHELGSLSAAARAMGMSYRRAWGLVQELNEHATRPLVKLETGGRGGGGAILTAEGQRWLQRYRHAEQAFREFLNTYRYAP